MPCPTDDVTVHPPNLEAAKRIQRAALRAATAIEATIALLIREIREVEKGEPPWIDGQPAIVNGEPVDLVEWLQCRLVDLAAKEDLAEGVRLLRTEAEVDPLEALVGYVREYREEAAHRQFKVYPALQSRWRIDA